MRFAARLAGIVLLVAGLAACKQTQVAQLQGQLITITVAATNTDAELFNVWDLTQTRMRGGVILDTTVSMFCESVPVNPGSPRFKIPIEAPWQHSLRVSILRADSTEFEQVTDDLYLDPKANLTPYDQQVLFGGNNIVKPNLTITDTFTSTCSLDTAQSCAMDSDCGDVCFDDPTTSCVVDADCASGTCDTQTCPAIDHMFVWSAPRQMTALNRAVVLATSNPLAQRDLSTYGFRKGLCSVSTDPGPATLAGAPQPFTWDLGKGDTIKVEARKAFGPPLGLIDDSVPAVPLTVQEAALAGRLAVDGIVITSLGGDTSSGTNPTDGFSFFYSSR